VTLLDSILLGLVEGITEFLPVSSTAHLLVLSAVLGIGGTAASNAYDIAIQAGAILAVLTVYPRRVGSLFAGVVGRDREGLRLAISLVAAFLPAAIIGVSFKKTIETHLFGPWPIVIAWVLGGVAILALRGRMANGKGAPKLDSLTWQMAVLIGLFQCLALWPGTSRSLATIVGGLMVGLSLTAAVEFSFLLGLLTLTAATALEVYQHGGDMLAAYGIGPILVGLVTGWITAVISVKWMIGWIEHRGMAVFAWWRFAAAAIVVALVLTGRWHG
jgi:undecaprenyl-diphosphatase